MNFIQIPDSEINFHSTSFCDRMGRVFWWEQGLYRGISKDGAAFYKSLFEKGIIQNLVAKGFLIDSESTDFTLAGYPLILKHRILPFVSYANEWCPEMLRDAGLFVMDMLADLINEGLVVDVSTWDILFDGYRPVYVDFCSIEPLSSYNNYMWRLLKDDALSYFIIPLKLMSKGYGNLARWVLSDYEHKVVSAEFAAMMGAQVYGFQKNDLLLLAKRKLPDSLLAITIRAIKFIKATASRLAPNNKLSGLRLIRKLRKEMQRIPMPSSITDLPENSAREPGLTPDASWTQKHRSVYEVLSGILPGTVLDIGCGRGWYSRLAASLGSQVVALDVNDRQVAYCYETARQQDLPILSLVMDIRYPSPGHGSGKGVIAPAVKRLQCEMVFVLSLVHLLVFEQHITFEQMVETFASLSKKWLLVEFISTEDPYFENLGSEDYSWYRLERYTLENFIQVLKRWFKSIEVVAAVSESRLLILCAK